MTVEELMQALEGKLFYEQHNLVRDHLQAHPDDVKHPSLDRWITDNASAVCAYVDPEWYARHP